MITVCIPAYRARWLEETLASVAAQGMEVETVVYEDLEGKGAGWARNQAFLQATGDWILKLDADDLLTPGLLEQLWAWRSKNLIVCPEAAQFFDADGLRHRWSYAGIEPGQVLTRIQSPASSAGCLLYHRDLHGAGWAEDCGAYESWVFVCERVAAGHHVLPVPGTEYLHRLHPDSYWGTTAAARREDLHRALLRVNEVYAEAWA